MLDHGHFAGVPPTAMVTCQPNMLPGSLGSSVHGAKVGSLQQFVPATTDCEEQGASAFPVHEVHKIAQVCASRPLAHPLQYCVLISAPCTLLSFQSPDSNVSGRGYALATACHRLDSLVRGQVS